mgnify:CR=1 FL=1
MKIISSTQLKELDKYTIAKEPVASIDLMERAAEELTRAITHRWDTSFHIVVSVSYTHLTLPTILRV